MGIRSPTNGSREYEEHAVGGIDSPESYLKGKGDFGGANQPQNRKPKKVVIKHALSKVVSAPCVTNRPVGFRKIVEGDNKIGIGSKER